MSAPEDAHKRREWSADQVAVEDLVSPMEKVIENRDLARSMGLSARNYVLENHTIEKSAKYHCSLVNMAFEKVFE